MNRFVTRLLLSLLIAAAGLQAGTRDALWKQVGEEAGQDKPETAIALLKNIESAAVAEKAWPEAARALGIRLRLQANHDDEEPGRDLREIDAAAATASAEMRPILQALSAVFHSGYFTRNRWELMSRTAVAGAAGTDVSSWDLRQLIRETDLRFQKALENSAQLKATSITKWDGLLEPGTVPDTYQPTLYDFVVRQALQFYTAAGQEAAEVKAENAFEFTADSPALGTLEEFLAWKTGDGTSPKQRAIRLYQALLAFHRGDADPGALAVLDVDRLAWAGSAISDTGAESRQKPQFLSLAEKYAAHECSLTAAAHGAGILIKEKQRGQVHALLTRLLAAHGKSVFAPRCRNLIASIEAKELEASTELLWNAAGPQIHFTARNLEKIHFRLIPVAKEATPAVVAGLDDEDLITKLLRKRPVREWALDLGKQSGFESQTHHVPAPVDVKPGLYLLAVSGNAEFIKRRNQISFAPVIVSSLALVTQSHPDKVEAWVLDAVTGEPVPGAAVSLWREDEKTEKLTPGPAVQTDSNGYGILPVDPEGSDMVYATFDGAFALSDNLSSYGSSRRPLPGGETESTFFFTDRAIYRPGQAIQYKGIRARHDTRKNDYRTVSGAKRTVVLKDANEREIAKQEVTTNDFGSFSGTFTAPPSGITGEMTIEDGKSQTRLRVEEYKRPRFKAEILPPAAPAASGQEVVMKVKATGYTGAPVDGAAVVWHVMRKAEWSASDQAMWWFQHSGSEKQIARGTAVTGTDGTAEIKFTAHPDKSVDAKTTPWFHFTVHADITDTAGETRSAEGGVRVGETTMKADVRSDDWQTVSKPAAFTITTSTLDDAPVKAAGKLTVHRLTAPEKVHRRLLDDEDSSDGEPVRDLSDITAWDTGEVVQRNDVSTNDKGEATAAVKLSAGAYRAIFEASDAKGKKVTAQTEVVVVDPAAAAFPVKIPFWSGARSLELQPGDSLNALWGSGYDRARAFVQIEHRDKVVRSFWTDAGRTQQAVDFKITEEHRGGLAVHIMQMRDNRLEATTLPVSVPWTNKNLTLKWEHLTSKLEPGAKDTWSLSIAGADREKAAAELTAVLYDASLDALTPHQWPMGFDCFYHSTDRFSPGFHNEMVAFEEVVEGWGVETEPVDTSLRDWPFSVHSGYALSADSPRVTRGLRFGFDGVSRNAIDALISGGSPSVPTAAPAMAADPFESADYSFGGAVLGMGGAAAKSKAESAKTRPAGESAVAARRNLQETAFFLPQLRTADDGTVKLEFTMPEAVTAWRFMGLAHDKKLRSGYIEGSTVTARDLMVQPNAPRFLREGDTVEFTAKITNQSESPQKGTARLSLADAATLQPLDAVPGLAAPEQSFEIPAKESRTVSWRLQIPDGQGFLTWKTTAATDKVSDGEEGWLPVLPRRTLVTESLPLSITEAGTREFVFEKLRDHAASPTLRHQSLTVQMTSQPAWYAVMALPYLIEFPHECSEQTFNRFYANTLARHIAGRDPAIRRVFDLWRSAQPGALQSPLFKNQDLKSVLIEETPWVREATSETEQRRNAGLLFDSNRLDSETARVLEQLKEMQNDDGSWPWFPGGPRNEFITLYVVSGFGRLRHLGVEVDTAAAVEALDSLDKWLVKEHNAALKADRSRKDGKEGDHLSASIALYLYARSFFQEERPPGEEVRPALDFFLAQARSHWAGKGRMTQAHAALGLKRFGDKAVPGKILASLKERSVLKPDLGRYWTDEESRWRWDAAPLETQALMIEAFREIGNAVATADECALWLLRQKQTQAWPGSKATADACYALLLGSGPGKLSSGSAVSVSLGGTELKPENVEAGTGFFEMKIPGAEINAGTGSVKLTRTEPGPAWGSVHWQYLEDLSKLTPQEGSPLKVTKALFTKVMTAAGPELRPVQGKVKTGDELVVRLELRTDRDLEFVHLKDQRASSVEPVNVLSGYQYYDGLACYVSTRDTASHYFFDLLPKGTHVFEYSARVQLRGACQTGVAELQCMYAPEFNSHSASTLLEAE